MRLHNCTRSRDEVCIVQSQETGAQRGESMSGRDRRRSERRRGEGRREVEGEEEERWRKRRRKDGAEVKSKEM